MLALCVLMRIVSIPVIHPYCLSKYQPFSMVFWFAVYGTQTITVFTLTNTEVYDVVLNQRRHASCVFTIHCTRARPACRDGYF